MIILVFAAVDARLHLCGCENPPDDSRLILGGRPASSTGVTR